MIVRQTTVSSANSLTLEASDSGRSLIQNRTGRVDPRTEPRGTLERTFAFKDNNLRSAV